MTKVSLHRFANLPGRFLSALGLGIGILTVGAIAPPPHLTDEAASQVPTTIAAQFAHLPQTLNETETVWLTAARNLPEVLTVTLFTPNATCEAYDSTPQVVAKDKPITQIVHRLLSQQVPQLIEFELAGYRIQRNLKERSVTIDLRRPPEASRPFVSLSVCEGKMLLGSVRETLLRNGDLDIQTVRFTERGEPL